MPQSIQFKQSLYTGLIIVMVTILLITGSSYFFTRYADEANREAAVKGVAALQLTLDGCREQVSSIAIMTASRPEVIQAVAGKDPVAGMRVVTGLSAQAKLTSLQLADSQGRILAGEGKPLQQQSVKRVIEQGQTTSYYEDASGEAVLSVTVTPVKDAAGNVVGAVAAGMAVSRDDFVDKIKGMQKVDATVFAGDVRVSTTIIQEDKRVVGTKLDSKIAAAVLGSGQTYAGAAKILGMPYVTYYQPLLGLDQKPVGILFAGKSEVEALAVRNKTLMTLGLVGLFVLLLGIAFSIWTARKLTKPILAVERLMEEAGSGDLTVRAEVTSRDEIGRLLQAFNTMMENQSNLVGAVSRTSKEIAFASEHLAASSEEMSSTINEVASNMGRVANNALSGEQAAETVSEALDNLAKLIVLAKDRAVSAQDASSVTSQAATKGQSTVASTVASIDEMKAKILETEELISRLNEYSSQIGVVTETITSIAGQTNLLALNAAIEAARAGEAGRGFAVVAEEVRKLAEQASSGAQKVTTLLSKVTENTAAAVKAAEHSRAGIEHVVSSTDAASSALASILTAAGGTVTDTERIMKVADDEVATSDRIVELINSLTRGLKETTGLSREVAAASEQTASVVETVAASAEQLTSMAAELKEMVVRFKI